MNPESEIWIYVSRDGEQIGAWPLEDAKLYLKEESLLEGDLGWHDGLSEWMPLSKVLKSKTAAVLRPSHSWRDDPATDNQIEYLKAFGEIVPKELTKGAASDLLGKLTSDPVALMKKDRIAQKSQHEAQKEESEHQAFYIRRFVDEAKDTLKTAEKTLEAAIAANGEEDIEDLRGEVEDAKRDLVDQINWRVDFWRFLLGQDPFETGIEPSEKSSNLAEHFSRESKCPSKKQTESVLLALDEESSDWDKTDPHKFVVKLLEIYPNLKSASKLGRRKNSQATPAVKQASKNSCAQVCLIAIFLFFALFLALVLVESKTTSSAPSHSHSHH